MDSLDKDRGSLQGVQNHKTTFDQARMWKKLKQKDNKRRFGFLWFIGGVIVLGVSVFMITTQLDDDYGQIIDNPSATDQVVQSTASKSTAQLKEQNRENLKSENENSTPITPSQATMNTVVNEGKKQNRDAETDISKSLISSVRTAKSRSKEVSKTQIATNIEKLNIEHPKSKEGDDLIQNMEKISHYISTSSQSDNSVGKRQEKSSTNIKFIPLIEQLETLRLAIAQSLVESTLEFPLELSIARSQTKSLSLGLHAGYGLVSRSLSGINSDHLTYRTNNEKALEHISAGISIDYALTNQLYVKTGLWYEHLSTTFDYSESELLNLEDVDPALIPSSMQGVEGFAILIDEYIYHNQVDRISIPLQIGVSLPSFSGLSLEGGPTFTLWNKYQGDILSSGSNILPLADANVAMGLLGFDFGLNYQLPFKHMPLSLGLRYSAMPTITADQINENNQVFGLRLGTKF